MEATQDKTNMFSKIENPNQREGVGVKSVSGKMSPVQVKKAASMKLTKIKSL